MSLAPALLLYAGHIIVAPVFRIILKVFLSRSTEELYELRDGRFDLSVGGQGVLIGSTVNGSSFTFGIGTTLSALDIQMYAQTAIEHKERGICAPVTRTTARFV
jgi:hypothetical protein